MSNLLKNLSQTQDALEPLLKTLMQSLPKTRLSLCGAYSVLNGGKRFRAHLTLMTGRILQVPSSYCMHVAAVIEMVHAYSLIHDDLPSMDNADIRRGVPSAHKAYDEVTALLAGNALLTFALQHLSTADCHPDPIIRLKLIKHLTYALGFEGMMLGQMQDVLQTGTTLEDLVTTESLKTGHLMAFSVQAPLVMMEQNDPDHPLIKFSRTLGLVYQMIDDLLDHIGDPKILGKPVYQDKANRVITFMDFYTPDTLKAHALQLLQDALYKIPSAFNPNDEWHSVVSFILKRLS